MSESEYKFQLQRIQAEITGARADWLRTKTALMRMKRKLKSEYKRQRAGDPKQEPEKA
jgi:hypothetical protein